MDFYKIIATEGGRKNKEDYVISPDFTYGAITDLICKGGNFYAYWNGEIWETDRNKLVDKIDEDIWEKKNALDEKHPDRSYGVNLISSHRTGLMTSFEKYLQQVRTKDPIFNNKILFADDTIKKTDYVTNKLDYTPTKMDTPAFDEMMDVLYNPEELEKILWFMGVILTNQSSKIQKFMYLYGGKGSGKGTVIKIIRRMFHGYHDKLDLANLTSNSEFATSEVKEIPILIDDDSDISKISRDINLLKLTGHDPITVNRKYTKVYEVIFNGLLVTASNQRFQVRNIDSGITRRAVVVEPSGRRLDRGSYDRLMKQIKFEIPGIAQKAIDLVTKKGIYYYENTMDIAMVEATDLIFSFIREYKESFKDVITLNQASMLYKEFLEDLGYDTKGYKRRIKIELQRYYDEFHDQKRIGEETLKNVYVGFKKELVYPDEVKDEVVIDSGNGLVMDQEVGAFDRVAGMYPAQYATPSGTPTKKWDEVTTTLNDINRSLLHYVRVPINHIVLDFDLKDESGEKNLERNLKAASEYPETYAELSKSGKGVHLHYIYEGEPTMLSSLIEPDIEIKVYTGLSSLRRQLTKCNDKDIAHISTGLPLKEERQLNEKSEEILWNEKKMRTSVERNLRKEYHDATKPSVDFIAHIFKRAEQSGVKYDLTDMRQAVLAFAMNSSNNAKYCMGVVRDIKWSTIDEAVMADIQGISEDGIVDDSDIHFFDIEIYPNLMIFAWKKYGDKKGTVWYNPTPEQVESVMTKPMGGFNCRKYDNHIVHSKMMGKSNMELYQQSQSIISNNGGMIGSAYELSYIDIYEYASKKQSLKKWEIELGIHHDELEFPWDQPLPEDKWPRAGEYCLNDVDATEAVFNATKADYTARKILSKLSGLSMNAKTQQHAEKFLFGNDPRPQDKFVYTDLSGTFPGYKYEFGKSSYRGEDPSEGGYVYSEPGVHKNVVLLDVASMHPNSLVAMNYFGPYTQRFKELIEARIAIKHKDYDSARKMFNGMLAPFLTNEEDAEALSYALKIIINIVYGMTSAPYDNKFKHKDNKDNIVAKRGALFMIDLKNAVQAKGYKVAHIKTDSIKVVDADDELINFVHEFGKKYKYNFEHEATYEKMALVNDAVYIAKYGWAEKEKKIGTWEATGAQFAEPYVFKTLFSHEEIDIEDYAQTKQVTGAIHLGDKFVGKVAKVYASITGDEMFRIAPNKKAGQPVLKKGVPTGEVHPEMTKAYVTGTKGHRWKLFSELTDKSDIDVAYYDAMVKSALDNIQKVGHLWDLIEYVPKQYEYDLLPF